MTACDLILPSEIQSSLILRQGCWALQDSLALLARLLGAVLGPQHAVTPMLAEAAEANMSSTTRSTLHERERIQQVRLWAIRIKGFDLGRLLSFRDEVLWPLRWKSRGSQ